MERYTVSDTTMRVKTDAGRLTEYGAQEVLRHRAEGMTYREIASALDVTVGTVYNVVRRRTWKWLESPTT